MTDLAGPGSLKEALREHIFWVHAHTPADERRRSHWVMDPEWLNDVRMLDSRSFWHGPVQQPETLLGLPMKFRKGAGPPHLEL